MAYEVDFIGVSQSKSKQDADAISLRWKDGDKYKVLVYDGGLQAHGEKLKDHLNEYYFDKDDEKVVDAVVVSHSDQDHTSGLKIILENFKVNALYMNRPWLYAEELYDKISDGRITVNSLEQRLKEKYSYIADLEKLAMEKKIKICDAFEGDRIEDKFTVLSPSRDFYLELIVESDKTPLDESAQSDSLAHSVVQKFTQYVKNLLEAWDIETLREDVTTSAENEMSVVLFGEMDECGVLLVGDAGLRSLNRANEYASDNGISLRDNVSFMQIPHHGGRHNVSTSLLDDIIGTRVKQGETTNKVAYVCAAENSDHPLQMVVNAYVRRGVKVYVTKGNIIHHNKNMPERAGWTALINEPFDPNVENWD